MDQPTHVLVFALGCLGALAPEIVRLYELRRKKTGRFSKQYILISLVYSVTGGVVAIILPATTLWSAFYAGVTWPLLLSTGFKHRIKKVALQNDGAKPKKHKDTVYASDNAPTFFETFVDVFRNHADGLF